MPLARITLALVAALLGACRGGSGPTGGATLEATSSAADEALILAVRDAASREIGVDSISRVINVRPSINTRQERDRLALLAADFAPDPDRVGDGPPPSRWRSAEAIDVVYWARPGDWPNPRVVGVVWFQGGHQEVFFAEVLDP